MGFGPSISFCGPASAVQTATASHTISACRTRHALHTRWILALPTAALHCTSAVDGSAGHRFHLAPRRWDHPQYLNLHRDESLCSSPENEMIT